jgi:type IV pilus assembly protein PilC
MANYSYIAVDPRGSETRGILEVANQSEAVRRVREMGLFPTKIKVATDRAVRRTPSARSFVKAPTRKLGFLGTGRKVKTAKLVVFTRQMATMVGAGMSLLRSLRILEEQEESRTLRAVIRELELSIENGGSFSEAIALYPRIFTALYVNLVRAGESAGALDLALCRLAEFMEKAQRIKGKLKAALVYPCIVLVVATAVTGLLMTVIVPRFRDVFEGLLEGAALPAFTRFVFGVSGMIVHRLPFVLLAAASAGCLFMVSVRTALGRRLFDQVKLSLPVIGPLFRKAAISRFARTFGTLVGSGVPILQALTIVEGTAGNLIIGEVIARVREQVKQGDPIAPNLKASRVFPAMVAGLVDVGEQTGALPELLMKIADTYEEEFDNAASGLTSLLEPILIILLAVIVGSIVVAMFLPLITVVGGFGDGGM